jgi:acyl dehydratase
MTPSDPLPPNEITITQEMIDEYARISGDFNPLHVDVEAAARTPFGGTIAHGCIPMEPIFKVVQRIIGKPVMPAGTRMSLRYLQPSRPGDTIRLELRDDGNDGAAADLVFACVNQRGDKVIEGRCTLG